MTPRPDHIEQAHHPAGEGACVRKEAQATLTSLLPWGVSLAIHAALVALALVVIWAAVSEPETKAGVVMQTPTMQVDDQLDMRIDERKPVVEKQADVPMAAEVVVLPPVGQEMDTIGTYGRSATPHESRKIADAVLLPMVKPTRILPGPDRGVFGLIDGPIDGPDQARQAPRRVVYLIDASGSLIDTFPFVTMELKRSIGRLPSDHQYTVIFFQDGKVIEPRPLGLKEASPITRLEMMRWIDQVRPGGRTSPVPALERALSYRPSDVHLLSDNITGGGTGATEAELEQRRILNAIRQSNRGARIHTIQFLYPDPLASTPGMRGTLEQVARMTGGRYEYITEDDLLGNQTPRPRKPLPQPVVPVAGDLLLDF